MLAEMKEEAKEKAAKVAEKKRLELLRVKNIMRAREELYNSVRPVSDEILTRPLDSYFLNVSQDVSEESSVGSKSGIGKPKRTTMKPSEAQKADMLLHLVTKDLVDSMADAISLQQSKDLIMNKNGDTAGDSLDVPDSFMSADLSVANSEEEILQIAGKKPNVADGENSANIPLYILNSNLSLVDPTGMSIVPQEASVVKKGDEKGLKLSLPIADLDAYYLGGVVKAAEAGDVLAGHLLEGFISKGFNPASVEEPLIAGFDLTARFPEITSFDKCAHEILIRIWNKDASNPNQSGKGDFLGFVILNSADLQDPPKGIRALSLMPDEALSTPKGIDKEILPVTGSISVKLHATKWSDGMKTNTNKVGFPCEWRLQVVKASKIACVDRNAKSSPFCEVFWRGRAIRDGLVEHYSDWLGIKSFCCPQLTILFASYFI